MANGYFNHIANRVQAGTRAIAANVNDVADEVAQGFDLLPTESELKTGTVQYAIDTGVADAYVLTTPYTESLIDGYQLSFKAVNANTGAATANVNGTGIKSIVNPDGTALIANTFSANAIVIIAYEITGDRWILVSQNPAQSALAQASAVAAAASAAAALVSEGNAATSESNASTSASNASTSETNAGTSETNAGTSETNAAASEAAADATLKDFETKYLGAKASDPTLDNEGGALIDGALYFNTTSNLMKVYDLGGVTWSFFQDGGNAATLDSLDSTQFLRSDTSDAMTGDLTVNGNIIVTGTVDGIDIATDVAANTAKVSNATHTGQVTGSTALALAVTAITAQPASGAVIGTDTMLINDGGTLSEVTIDQLKTYIDSNLTHTGQVTGTTALALDVSAITAQPASGAVVGTDTMIINDGGVLSEVTLDQLDTFFGGGGGIGGSITDNQIAVGATTADDIEGSANLTFDGTRVQIGSSTQARVAAAATAYLELSSDPTFATGTNLIFYGNSQAVIGGDFAFKDGAANLLYYDSSNNRMTFTLNANDAFVADSDGSYFPARISEQAVSTGTTIDCTAGTYFYRTISGNTTWTFSNPDSRTGAVTSFTLEMTNPGAFTLTWPTSVDWSAGTEPTWTASGVDIVSFVTRDNGTTWYGFLGGQAFA
jgi:hypothetical protein